MYVWLSVCVCVWGGSSNEDIRHVVTGGGRKLQVKLGDQSKVRGGKVIKREEKISRWGELKTSIYSSNVRRDDDGLK